MLTKIKTNFLTSSKPNKSTVVTKKNPKSFATTFTKRAFSESKPTVRKTTEKRKKILLSREPDESLF
jgi:hypothetical protein